VTIRAKLEMQRRRAGLVMLAGWFSAMTGMILGFFVHPILTALCAVGFIVMAAGVIYHFVKIRCPSCRGPLCHALNWPPTRGLFRFSARIRFCPFCGVSLDKTLEDTVGAPDAERNP